MQLQTDRLVLRQLERRDLETLFELVGDERIARTTLNIPHPYTWEDALWYFDFNQEQWQQPIAQGRTFAVTLRESDTFIGNMSVRRGEDNTAILGYWFGVPHWGQGYATEAAKAAIRFAFEVMDVELVQADYFIFNPASRRVQEKAGMTYQGDERGKYEKHGEKIDVGRCAITRDEWNMQQAAD